LMRKIKIGIYVRSIEGVLGGLWRWEERFQDAEKERKSHIPLADGSRLSRSPTGNPGL